MIRIGIGLMLFGLAACVPPSAPTTAPPPNVGYVNPPPSGPYPARGYPAPYSPSAGYYGRPWYPYN